MKTSFSIGKLSGAVVTCLALSLGTVPVQANPTGAAVQFGDITFVNQGNTLQVIQGTQNGIVNWNSFSINAGETTRFVQPNSNSATLNRVTGSTASYINGNLFANGRVFLLNSNGILVGSQGVVDVGSFTASTLEMSDQDFLDGGDYTLRGPSQAAVVNLGSISAFDGDIFLVAAQTENAGSLSAPRGTVGLAAGNDVLIAESGSERVFVRGAGGGRKDTGVVNKGTIDANIAELKAHGGNVYGMAVKNEGRVAATAVSREGGQIFLRAGGGRIRSTGTLKATSGNNGGSVVVDGGSEGLAEVGGDVDASGTSGVGGSVTVVGDQVEVLENARIAADGDAGGGEIRVGGGIRGEETAFQNATTTRIGNGATLSANALVNGDGGMVITFANKDLYFEGRAEARGGAFGGDGGFIELSGKESVTFPGFVQSVDAGAPVGRAGSVLFDPININLMPGYQGGEVMNPITASPVNRNTLYASDVRDFLAAGIGDLTVTTDVSGPDSGIINVFDSVDITWNSASSLKFFANSEFVTQGLATFNSQGSGGIEIYANERILLGNGGAVPTFTTNSGLLKVHTGSGSTAKGIFLNDAMLSSGTGDIEIFGYNAMGDGVTINGSQISSAGGEMTIEGRSYGGNGNGLVFLSKVGNRSQVSNSSGGKINLAGQGNGTGNAIVFNNGNGAHGFYDYLINGDYSTDIELRSYGGDVLLSHLTGDGLLFQLGNGASGALNLVNTDILGRFTSPSSNGIFIQAYNSLDVGDVNSSGPINLYGGLDVNVNGQITSPQPVTLTGEFGIFLGQPVNAPGLNLIGGMYGIDVGVLGTFNLEGVTFTNVNRVVGGSEVGDDILIGSSANDQIGVSTIFPMRYYEIESAMSMEVNPMVGLEVEPMMGGETAFTIGGIQFEGFEQVSGGGGNDTFNIQLDENSPFIGTLGGGSGNDRFVMMPGGEVAFINGGPGTDTIDYSNFTDPVTADFSQNSATQVGGVSNLERVIGGMGIDTLNGTPGNDQFRITGLNSGFLNNGQFSGFELLNGLAGQDSFIFQNQGNVNLVNGNGGVDTFALDDRNLGGTNIYTVGTNSVTRNPTYNFNGIEVVQLFLGSGNDTVNVTDNGKINFLDGGPGIDTLNVPGGGFLGENPITLGSSTIFNTNFELPVPSGDITSTPGTLLTTTTNNAGPSDNNNPDQDTTQNNFSGSTNPSPGAFAAFTTTTTVLGQAAVIQAGANGAPPFNLDGTVGFPPVIVIGELNANLESAAWIELASAIQFAGPLIIVMQDGGTSLDLAGLPPAEMLTLLAENLRAGAAQELLGALELTMIIPVTSLDGPVSILTVPIPIEPEILALLGEILGDDAFSELTSALDG